MMGVTSLEVYNTVYNITLINNKLKMLRKNEQLKSLNVDIQLVVNVEYLNKISDKEKGIIFKIDSYSKNRKLTRKYFDQLREIIHQIIQNKTTFNIPDFGIEFEFFEIELTPGVYELVDIDITIKQIHSDSNFAFELYIQAGTISMKSVLTISTSIRLNAELKTLLGFTNKENTERTHESEKPVMITTTETKFI